MFVVCMLVPWPDGEDEGGMVECDNRVCMLQWFHFECVGHFV